MMVSAEEIQDQAAALQKVGKVAPHMELVRLKMTHGGFAFEASPKGADEAGRFQTTFNASWEAPSERRVISTIRLELRATTPTPPRAADTEGPSPQSSQFTIKATFELEYVVAEGSAVSKDALDLFARINGVYNSWPYWREFVQSMTARMQVPTLTVPLLRSSEAAALVVESADVEEKQRS
jgi:hypothetical protein